MLAKFRIVLVIASLIYVQFYYSIYGCKEATTEQMLPRVMHVEFPVKQNAEQFLCAITNVWECFENPAVIVNMCRLRVPDGWLVVNKGSYDAPAIFVKDIACLWTGEAVVK